MENGFGGSQIDKWRVDIMKDKTYPFIRVVQVHPQKIVWRLDVDGRWPTRTWLQCRLAELRLTVASEDARKLLTDGNERLGCGCR